MSYILDALRKADAQRESDPARGIHAQPVPLAAGGPRRDGYRTGFWAASAAGLVALVALGWYVYRDSSTAAAVAPHTRTDVAVAAVPVPVTTAPDPAPVPAAAEPPAAAVMPPPVVVAPPIAPVPPVVQAPPAVASAPPVETASAVVPTSRQAARAARVAAAEAASAKAEGTVASALPQAAPAPVAAEPAASVTGLPSDAPKLAISGGVYSANVAQRMLIVNGQVFNEGSEIGPGVVLEEIRPKAAVLKFRGSRYTVTY